MLSGLLLSILVASVPSASTPAPSWGATPAQIEAETPGTQHVDKGEKIDVGRVGSKGPLSIGSNTYRASYFYGETGLSRIDLKVADKLCRDVSNELQTLYGPALRVFDQNINGRVFMRIVLWHDTAAATRVRFNVGSGFCSLHLEPLASYRERDLSSPAREVKELEVR